MDLSRPFNTQKQTLLIAKLGAYGFDAKALNYTKGYYIIGNKQFM